MSSKTDIRLICNDHFSLAIMAFTSELTIFSRSESVSNSTFSRFVQLRASIFVMKFILQLNGLTSRYLEQRVRKVRNLHFLKIYTRGNKLDLLNRGTKTTNRRVRSQFLNVKILQCLLIDGEFSCDWTGVGTLVQENEAADRSLKYTDMLDCIFCVAEELLILSASISHGASVRTESTNLHLEMSIFIECPY